MAKDLPTDPLDKRWLPPKSVWITAAVIFQIVIGGWGVLHYLYGFDELAQPGLLVNAVLSPEDLVFSDTDVAMRKGKRLAPIDVRKAVVSTDKARKEGVELYTATCASCHGEKGLGDGPSGATLDPKPRNLAVLAGWEAGTRLSDVFRTITLGLEGTQMSAYDYLSHEERFAIAHHVQTLGSGHTADSDTSLARLDKQFSLSQGAKEPNIIPLSVAVDKVIAEAKAVPTSPDSSTLAKLNTAAPGGESLFRRIVSTEARASYTLVADSSWIESPDRFRAVVTSGAPANGFKANASLLTVDEWRTLHRYAAMRFWQLR
jgi:mono/diheme cytochrome c family protein